LPTKNLAWKTNFAVETSGFRGQILQAASLGVQSVSEGVSEFSESKYTVADASGSEHRPYFLEILNHQLHHAAADRLCGLTSTAYCIKTKHNGRNRGPLLRTASLGAAPASNEHSAIQNPDNIAFTPKLPNRNHNVLLHPFHAIPLIWLNY
jgi:hypothetical protein